MRSVFLREVKELALPGLLLVAAGAITGAAETGPLSYKFEDLVVFPIVGGLALGCLQGVLDRLRRADLFALHRPAPAGRMEIARTSAGLLAALAGFGALVACHRIATAIELSDLERLRAAVEAANPGIREVGRVTLIDPSRVPDHLGGREALLLGSLLLAAASIARFAAGSVRPRWAPAALVALPFLAWSLVAQARLAAGVLLLLAALFAFGSWLSLVGDRRWWQRGVRSVLLLVLVGTLALEGIAWLRVPLTSLVHATYPTTGIASDGSVVYYDHERVREGERMVDVFRFLDEGRRVFETRRDFANLVLPGDRWSSRAGWKRLEFEYPHFLVGALSRRLAFAGSSWGSGGAAPLEALARVLNVEEGARRGISPHRAPHQVMSSPLGPGWSVELPPRLFIEWTAEAGRLVCREASSGRVLAGLGPDGFVAGDGGADGARFGTLIGFHSDTGSWSMIDAASRCLVVVSAPTDAKASVDSKEPLEAGVELRPLRPWDGVDDGARKVTASIARLDGEHLLFFDDGAVFVRFELEPEEIVTGVSGARALMKVRGSVAWEPDRAIAHLDVGIETELAPAPPGVERRRFRLFRPGQPPVERDVRLEPARPSEILPANFAASLALLRPFPLNAASAASALPKRWNAWWWRDPWLAGGSYPGWLLLSLGLAAFCAGRARRGARERCATRREVHLWTAAVFLLGPVGLLWMKLVLPRVPVEAVGGARRAVNLDASPSTAAPWPEPKPLGIEVLS